DYPCHVSWLYARRHKLEKQIPAKVGGPVQYRWIVEGCIAEAFLLKEILVWYINSLEGTLTRSISNLILKSFDMELKNDFVVHLILNFMDNLKAYCHVCLRTG
ncbi:hypothetical protein ACJX0J_022193, partial [Zea mays]